MSGDLNLMGVEKQLEHMRLRLDVMADALVKIATVEERTNNHTDTIKRMWAIIEALEKRVNLLEKSDGIQIAGRDMGSKVFWILFTGGISLLSSTVGGLILYKLIGAS